MNVQQHQNDKQNGFAAHNYGNDEVVKVTPKNAEEWLKSSNTKKNLSRKKVNEYIQQIKNGEWQTGEPKPLSTHDVDKLAAIINTGETVTMRVRSRVNQPNTKRVELKKYLQELESEVSRLKDHIDQLQYKI